MKTRKALAFLLSAVLLAGLFTPFVLRADGVYHVVREGDRLWRIAREHGITYEELAAYNNLPDPAFIRPGQVLRIPAPGRAAAPAVGQTAMYANFPAVPDFMAFSPYAVLYDSGTAAQLEVDPTEPGIDYILYMFWHDLPIDLLHSESARYRALLHQYGFIYQGNWHGTWSREYFYYLPAQSLTVAITLDGWGDEGWLDITITQGNFYAFLQNYHDAASFGWDDDWFTLPEETAQYNPALIGTWLFVDSWVDFYFDLLQNETVFYTFTEEVNHLIRSGVWGTLDANGNVTRYIPLNWFAYGDDVFLYFPSINYFREYTVAIHDGTLFLIGRNDNYGDLQILLPAPADFHVPSPFQPPADWLRDERVAHEWRFYETNNFFYASLMLSGDVLYTFRADGTGYWGGVEVNPEFISDIPLYWWTQDNRLMISFPSIDLLLIYEFDVVTTDGEYRLVMTSLVDEDAHVLKKR